jgi:hypothetical protein
MQIAVTIALTVIYVGLSLTLGGVHSSNGPWWFFLPCIVSVCAFVVAKMIMAKLPLPWVNEKGYSSPPRRVHLSWRATVRLPAYAPFLLILWHFLSILRMHFGKTTESTIISRLPAARMSRVGHSMLDMMSSKAPSSQCSTTQRIPGVTWSLAHPGSRPVDGAHGNAAQHLVQAYRQPAGVTGKLGARAT